MKPSTGRALTLRALAAGLDGGGLPDLGERADDRPWPDPRSYGPPPHRPDPDDVACPRCGVAAGERCNKKRGRYQHHRTRVDAFLASELAPRREGQS